MGNADRWPDFFLVGAMKAGTTSIYNYLGKHPRIFVPRIKEPHFFACDTCKKRHSLTPTAIVNEEDYLALFRGAGDDRLTGDFSVSNLWCKSAAERIFEKAPSAKIIAVLRNPIERCFSHYVMRVQQNMEHRSFKEAIEDDLCGRNREFGYLEFGQYYENVKNYFHFFPDENIKICWFEDFKSNKSLFISDMISFIGVDGDISAKDMNFLANTGGTPRGGVFSLLYKNRKYYMPLVCKFLPKSERTKIRDKIFITRSNYPKMTDEERALLISVYEEDISSLGDCFGKDLSGWLNNTS